ncbi:MAG: F0F1 ATP synthase subunit gamma [Pseudobdellovibrionaceae bacterium]
MPSLRDYRDRIASVKSTRKITSAMKMVAAAKLKRAQDQAEASQPYARAMAGMLARVAAGVAPGTGPKLLTGTGNDKNYLLIIVTSDRGLAGGFNANLIRMARGAIRELKANGKNVKVVCVGRKGRDLLRRTNREDILESYTGFTGGKEVHYHDADTVAQLVLEQFDLGQFDVVSLVFNKFRSVLVQKPSVQQLIPFVMPEGEAGNDNSAAKPEGKAKGPISPYAFEPSEERILAEILPRNLGVQIYRALLDSSAGEQAARMTAMDNATRNAGDMINRLTLEYNRARQAHITKELIEIISGAEAV